jgi:diaminopimelate epimerase
MDGKMTNLDLSTLAGREFRKMSGTGNDFIMLDNRQGLLRPDLLQALAARLCPRGIAVGADGLIALRKPGSETSLPVDFIWDFFNADGSPAEMCGNGARCAARFAHDLGLAGESMVFLTLAGPIRAWIKGDDLVRVALLKPFNFYQDLTLKAGEREFTLMGVNTGVPHAVIEVQDLASADVAAWGRALRWHQYFAPAGTNVNFVARRQGEVAIRTYERGVEGETLACGTGAVAAALTLARRHGLTPPLTMRTKSGEALQVDFTLKDGEFEQVFLEGKASYVYSGRLDREAVN